MIRTWPRIKTSSISRSNICFRHLSVLSHQHVLMNSKSIQTALPEQIQSEAIVNAACDSLRKGLGWDVLSRKLGPYELTNSIVRQVLLRLKQPVDAKCALGFFHWSAQRKHFNHEVSNYCIAIHILVRAKLIRDARALLESVLSRHSHDDSLRFEVLDSLLDSYRSTNSIPLVFDLLIQSYSKLRMMDIALDACQHLGERGFTLSIISYNMLIHVVQKSDRNALVWRIYEHMIQNRTYPNEVTVRSMIGALCKEGKLQEFLDIVDRIQGKRCSPAVLVNTSLILRMMEEGRVEEGMILMKRMLQKNIIIDTIFYSLIVYARVRLHGMDSAREVYEEMLKRGFQANAFLCTVFIGADCKEGRIEGAIGLMEEMEDMGIKPYNETFNHLIAGCAKAGRLEVGLKFYERMMEMGLLPSCLAFNIMVRKLCETGGTKQANEMLTTLMDKGFEPNEMTYSQLIAGHATEGNIQEVLKLYYELEFRSIRPMAWFLNH